MSVALDHPDLPAEREQRARSSNLLGLLFVGLFLAAAGLLGARTLLRALKRKAGLDPDFWAAGGQLWRYTALHFTDAAPGRVGQEGPA